MYLVFDIGGTTIKYAYVTQEGNILERGVIPTVKESDHAFYQSLIDVYKQYNNIEGIALSYPGLVSSEEGIAINSTALKFLNGRNICEELKALTNVNVSLENDAKCAALAEMWLGSLKGVDSGLVMVLGTGIGGAVIINGKIHKGKYYKAGEFGSFLSKKDEHNHYLSLGRTHSTTRLIERLASYLNIENDGKKVFEYIDHEYVYHEIKEYCDELAKVIYNMDYVLDLDVVSIGGGISSQKLFIEMLNHSFKELRQAYRDDEHDLEIVSCTFNNDANIIGALYNYFLGGK